MTERFPSSMGSGAILVIVERESVCSACPVRWRGHVLPSRDSRLCGHAIGLDSLAMASHALSPAST